jgi:hypothetical protein
VIYFSVPKDAKFRDWDEEEKLKKEGKLTRYRHALRPSDIHG